MELQSQPYQGDHNKPAIVTATSLGALCLCRFWPPGKELHQPRKLELEISDQPGTAASLKWQLQICKPNANNSTQKRINQ